MNNKSSPKAILCYAPEDDWLAHAIYVGIMGKKLDTLVTVKAPKGTVDYVISAINCP